MPKHTMPMLRLIGPEGQGGGSAPPANPKEGEGQQDAKTFTQDEVNSLVGQARADERRKAAQKYADYDDLKVKAGEAATAEDRIADLERKYADAEVARLRSDVAAQYGISAEDRDLFLTASTEDSLGAQAKRLAEREADRKKRGNVAPKEGGAADNPGPGNDEMREFTRNLFGRTAGDD